MDATSIQMWLYSEGTTDRDTQATIVATEGANVYTVTLSAPCTFAAALLEWKALLDAASPLTYTLAYSTTTRRVTISATGPFALTLPGSTQALLGFASAAYAAAASHTAEGPPGGRIDCAVESDVPQEAPDLDAQQWRHGRAQVMRWAGSDTWTIGLWLTAAEWAQWQTGFCASGKLRVYQGDTAHAYSVAYPGGYLDGYIAAVDDLQQRRPEGGLWSVRVALAVPRVEPGPSAGNCWAPCRYGWGLVYWMTVEGFPTLLTERETGQAIPGGWTSDEPVLVVDESAHVGSVVDRAKGLGEGFPLQFSLLDTTAVRALLAPGTAAKLTRIALDITSAAASIQVESTAGWAGGDTCWIGAERIRIGAIAAGPPRFTGCTRGVAGLAYPHRKRGQGALVTDQPRWWRGREVKLYAMPIDQSGVASGGTYLGDSELLWCGHIDDGPRWRGGRWGFRALPLDHRLSRPLSGRLTGVISDSQGRVAVKKNWTLKVAVEARNAAGAVQWADDCACTPFAGMADGTLLSASEIAATITAAWATAVALYGAGHWDGALYLMQLAKGYKQFDYGTLGKAGEWMLGFGYVADVNANWLNYGVNWGDSFVSWSQPSPGGLGGCLWSADLILAPSVLWQAPAPAQAAGLTLKLDEGDPTDVSAPGRVRVGANVWHFDEATADQAIVYLSDLHSESQGAPPVSSLAGQTAEIMLTVEPTIAWPYTDAAEVTLRCLESSGEAGLRGAYDDLPLPSGYAIPSTAIDEGRIAALLASGGLAGVLLSVDCAGKSLLDLVGPLLALSGHAICTRQTPLAPQRRCRLSAVETSAVGSGHSCTVLDSALLLGAAKPLEVEEARPAPNLIRVDLVVGDVEYAHHALDDWPAIQAQGAREETYEIPSASPGASIQVATWANARIQADQVAQAVTIRVAAWVDAHQGDVIWLTTTHPAIWSWTAQAVGYSGPARVLGRKVDLKSGVCELLLLVDGISPCRGLCPAMLALAWDNAAAPTWIEVGLGYLPILQQAFADSTLPLGVLDCIYYEPGAVEGVAVGYTFSGVTNTGTAARLAVSAIVGAPVLSLAAESTLTWPEIASADTYALTFAHAADGTFWG